MALTLEVRQMMDVAEHVPPASPPSSDEEVPTWGESKHSDGRPKAMVVVDPYSSGGVLARKVYDRGYHVIRVLSRSSQLMADQSLPAVCNGLDFAATVMPGPCPRSPDLGDVEGTIAKIRELDFDIVGFLCGAEPGVELFDAITSRWGGDVASNGEKYSAARRDKYLMGERVREAGLRAVKQLQASEWEEVERFVRQELCPHGPEGPMKVILKPVRSSSSEDVYLAESMQEVKTAFDTIRAHINQYGDRNTTVLVQEYLSGIEYVVNCVSKDGEHKVVSYWVYDKRAVNGSKFVYFGVSLFESPEGIIEKRMADYIRGVLDALDVKHGPSHAEVKWLDNEDQPCLVEIGCRPHGGDGVHVELATKCIGYNQVDAMIDLVECPRKFHALPAEPPRLLAHASVLMLVAYESGRLLSYRGLPALQAMQSFQNIEVKAKPHGPIHKTVDYMTNPGWVMLVHEEARVVRSDFETIHRMALEGSLYEIEPASN